MKNNATPAMIAHIATPTQIHLPVCECVLTNPVTSTAITIMQATRVPTPARPTSA